MHQQLSVFFCRFATSFAYYGLVMDLQKFGVSLLISTEANRCCRQLAVAFPPEVLVVQGDGSHFEDYSGCDLKGFVT